MYKQKIKTNQTIVVVDDDLKHHELISDFFNQKGFNVVCYSDASAVLEDSVSIGQSWDVLLTDYHFSNMLAVDFIKKISAKLPHLPIILITPRELTETAMGPSNMVPMIISESPFILDN